MTNRIISLKVPFLFMIGFMIVFKKMFQSALRSKTSIVMFNQRNKNDPNPIPPECVFCLIFEAVATLILAFLLLAVVFVI